MHANAQAGFTRGVERRRQWRNVAQRAFVAMQVEPDDMRASVACPQHIVHQHARKRSPVGGDRVTAEPNDQSNRQ